MSLDKLIGKLNKNKDRPAVMLANSDDSPCVVTEWISTGCLPLDDILGGGLPVGRIVEIYGDSSTGKTLIAEMVVLTAQQQGFIVIYIDTERAVSLDLMEELGIDTSKLIYADPDTMEEVFQLMEDVLTEKDGDDKVLFIWDSVAATTVEQEKNKDYGSAHMGRHALIMSQGLRKLNRLIAKHTATALFINQTRQKIGIMFGDDEATFGGKALAFYSSIRIRLKKGKKIKDAGQVIGILGHANIVKNKVAVPFKEADLPIYFGEGVDDAEACLLYLKQLGHVDTKGGWSLIKFGDIEIKFQAATWVAKVYDIHYDNIVEMLLGDG